MSAFNQEYVRGDGAFYIVISGYDSGIVSFVVTCTAECFSHSSTSLQMLPEVALEAGNALTKTALAAIARQNAQNERIAA